MYLASIYFSAFALLFFVYNTLWKRRTSADTRVAPEPGGAWPFIGHLPMLLKPNIPHIKLGALADKNGPAFTIQLGLQKALVVSSWEVAKECFTTNDKVLATRPSSVAVKIMAYNYAAFTFAPYGPYWRESRKMAVLELLSSHRLELLQHVLISEVSTSIKELYQIWQANGRNGNQSALVEMKQWLTDLTLNVILRMVAGKKYFGASVKQDDGVGKQLQKAANDFVHLLGLFVVSDALPSLGWLDIQGHEKAMRKTGKEMDNILQSWLEEHRQNKLAGGSEKKVERDFMDVMLSIVDGNNLFGYEADVVIKAACMNIFLAAADTTTVTLTWALSLLLNNRGILRKVQDEIDSNIGKDKHVEVADIEKLVYLKAVVKETLRLYPPLPLSVPHEAMKDCTIAGYHVPAGTRLISNLWKIQRDPRIWSNPCEFQPERFLTTHANVDFKNQHFEFIPFGSGRRSCPGMTFGLQVVHLTLSRLLGGFDFKTPSNATVDMTESAGLTNLKPTPIEVLIIPRLASNLY